MVAGYHVFLIYIQLIVERCRSRYIYASIIYALVGQCQLLVDRCLSRIIFASITCAIMGQCQLLVDRRRQRDRFLDLQENATLEQSICRQVELYRDNMNRKMKGKRTVNFVIQITDLRKTMLIDLPPIGGPFLEDPMKRLKFARGLLQPDHYIPSSLQLDPDVNTLSPQPKSNSQPKNIDTS